jgi:signal transduction histidine kinase/CheY-like chemotaxis protein
MASLRVLILVQDPGVRAELEDLTTRVPWGPARGLEFGPLEGDVSLAVSGLREREPRLPIGVVARDETAVLNALAAGADDAAVLTHPDPASLGSFVDRLELRARIRGEGQRLHDALAHAERLTALGTLVASIGHEINNPLTTIELSLDVARRSVLPAVQANPVLSQYLSALFDDLGSAADSVASIVRDLRVFARSDRDELPDLVEVSALVDQALRLVGRELSHALIERDYAPDLPKLVAPRNAVTQVIINLLVNAAHAMRELERPVHRVRVSVRADDEFVAIAISDTGPGVPQEQLERIFDPFFTTKRQQLGTGLGLSISRGILRRLGGELSAESVYGDGATFLCFLPIPSAEAVRGAARRAEVLPNLHEHREPKSILIVDDDQRVLRSYVRILNPIHRVLIAGDGRDAIEALESSVEPDVILLELDLPETDGRALLAWLAEHRPALRQRALVVTSAASRPEYEAFLRSYEGPVLHKPVRGDALLAAIDLLPRPARRSQPADRAQ